MLRNCKITVIKTPVFWDLVEEYAFEGFGECPVHKTGDVYYTNLAKPDGFCAEAWKAISQYVFALSAGGDDFYGAGTWMKPEHKGLAIAACLDGFRPVIFKIERAEE